MRTPDDQECPSHLRRHLLRWSALSFLPSSLLIGCGGNEDSASASNTSTSETSATSSSTGSSSSTTSTCTALPTETNGPYPADGTQTGSNPNALVLSGFKRSDIRSSIGTASGTATGIPLTLQITLADVANSCAALAGLAVYIWHCDKDGAYSLYTLPNENYLRGLQVSDAQGQLSFTTVFPGCYPGRWPHIHFEVYASDTTATSSPWGDWRLVSQIALPETSCRAVYANSMYGSSLSNLNRLSLSTDNVFSNDSGVTQLATVTGSNSAGYTATITVGLS